jgi:WD40 repeat protein
VQARPGHPVSLRADKEYVRDALFSADGDRLVTAGDEGRIVQWDWRSGQQLGSPIAIGAGVIKLASSPDGRLLAAGDVEGRVMLWDVARQQMIGVPLVGHTNIVRTVCFSPDGRLLASGGDDGVVVVWDLASRQPIAHFRHDAPETELSGGGITVAFNPDGTLLAATGLEKRILLWDIDMSSWARQACRLTNRNPTEEEWRRYIGDQYTYNKTCPDGNPRTERRKRSFRLW